MKRVLLFLGFYAGFLGVIWAGVAFTIWDADWLGVVATLAPGRRFCFLWGIAVLGVLANLGSILWTRAP